MPKTHPKRRLSSSLEGYLEAIIVLEREHPVARAKDIAAHLGVSSASVTGALRALSERGLVDYEPYGTISLTQAGRKRGEEVLHAHEALRDFLMSVLEVPAERADSAACAMEHAVPPDVLERFVAFAHFMNACPRAGATWVKGQGFHCLEACDHAECGRCQLPSGERWPAMAARTQETNNPLEGPA